MIFRGQDSPAKSGANWFGSLFVKFALVSVLTFTVPATVGLYWLSSVDAQIEKEKVASRIGNLSARIAASLERLQRRNDAVLTDQTGQAILNLLLADPAIRCGQIVSGLGAGEKVLTAVPYGPGCRGQIYDSSIALPLIGDDGQRLIVNFSTAEIEQSQWFRREVAAIVWIIGLIISLIATGVAFRLFVGRPVSALLGAIEGIKDGGEMQLLKSSSSDELGQISSSFNDMQIALVAQMQETAANWSRLERVYNATPALLCSVDKQGRILTVSDHWETVFGYDRATVIGADLKTCFAEEMSDAFYKEVAIPLQLGEPLKDVPLSLVKPDGSAVDVLFSASIDYDANSEDHIALCVMSDVSALKLAERQLEQLAQTDPLSDLPNRRGLVSFLEQSLTHARQNMTRGAVLYIDIDNFKWINDTFGHDAGDELLTNVAARLKNCLRDSDFVARLGGDEFAIVCPQVNSPAAIELLARRIVDRIARPFKLKAGEGIVGASIGIAFYSPDTKNADELLRLADLAMYQTKNRGKSGYTIYSEELGEFAQKQASMREQIRLGIDNDWFDLYLQPIIDLKTGQPVGAEALLRLVVPGLGTVSPDDFIPVAEESGQILELGKRVLVEGLTRLDTLQKQTGIHDFYFAINISIKQLNDELEFLIEQAISEYPAIKDRVVLEITESMFLSRQEEVALKLERLKNMGMRIALDDFGTGFSSLSHLQQFPVDIIKIDKSFVQALNGQKQSQRKPMAMIRATALMAHELGMKIVAEGVEANSLIAPLKACGVDYLQGFYFSEPIRFDDFCSWLRSARKRPAPKKSPAGKNPKVIARAGLDGSVVSLSRETVGQ